MQKNKTAFKDTDKIQADQSLLDLAENQAFLLELWCWDINNKQ